MIRKALFGIPLLFALVAAKELSEKQGRVFSLFSVVTFPNDECKFTGSTLTGICMTSSECGKNGGSSNGNCAAGFGVCCNIVASNCSASFSANATYLVSPSTFSKECSYTLNPQSGICQIRLDFVSFVLGVGSDTTVYNQASCDGTAAGGDSFTVTSPTGKALPPICGTNNGMHMYIENGASTSAVTFKFSTASTTLPKWNIKVSQIECSNVNRAPFDCLQYLTAPSGSLQTFGYNAGSGTMLQGQSYTICIKQASGYCKIDFTEGSTFFAVGDIAADFPSMCPNSAALIFNTGSASDLFCGQSLTGTAATTGTSGTVRAAAPPFTVGVVSSTLASTATAVAKGLGFGLNYAQVPCS